MASEDDLYRSLIDQLVHRCGSEVTARWVREASWPPSNHSGAESELLKRLDPADREVIVGMLADSFRGGVFNTLVVLVESGVKPFDKAYEGAAFNDFHGRLSGLWEWPDDPERWPSG